MLRLRARHARGGFLPNHPPRNLTIACTGASGAIFLRHFLLAVARDDRIEAVNFIASDSALRVMAEELGLTGRSGLISQILGAPAETASKSKIEKSKTDKSKTDKSKTEKLKTEKIKTEKLKTEKSAGDFARKIQVQSNADIGANVASGSYPADGMVVIPCSVGTLGRIANGIAAQLIERAADVTLKEKRPLVLCVRETPLNKIHIRNMFRAADAGATIFPLIPAFYYRPASLDEMAREFAYRVLAHLGLPQPQAFRWKG